MKVVTIRGLALALAVSPSAPAQTAAAADPAPAPAQDMVITARRHPGVKNWHGAAPATALTHIAIQEATGGRNVEWMEQVSDAQYKQ